MRLRLSPPERVRAGSRWPTVSRLGARLPPSPVTLGLLQHALLQLHLLLAAQCQCPWCHRWCHRYRSVPAVPAASLLDVIRGMRSAASAEASAPAAAAIHGPVAPAAGSSPVVLKMAARPASVSFAPENLVAQASRPSPLSGAAAILPSASEHVLEVEVTRIHKNANSGGKGKGAAPPINRTAVVEVLYSESDLVPTMQKIADTRAGHGVVVGANRAWLLRQRVSRP